MVAALHTSSITSLPLLARGKVRDNYAVGSDRILMVASDRLSAFDVIMGEPIPGKGELLTQMALFWFARLGHICPNHLTGEDPESVVKPEERAQVLWTHGVTPGKISENLMVAVLATNQAKVHGMIGRKGVIAPGADADIVVWDPDLTTNVTTANRHGALDYTPYEGMTFTGGPASVYIRGSLAYRDGEVLAEPGSGRFVHRSFERPAAGASVL